MCRKNGRAGTARVEVDSLHDLCGRSHFLHPRPHRRSDGHRARHRLHRWREGVRRDVRGIVRGARDLADTAQASEASRRAQPRLRRGLTTAPHNASVAPGTPVANEMNGGALMPRGDKRHYTDKQKRQAEHIEKGYEERGVPEREAERRAWATVNKVHHGGEKPGGGGYGRSEDHEPMRKGGRKGGRRSHSR